jgi:GNAT superfamily N-acetyltransferase
LIIYDNFVLDQTNQEKGNIRLNCRDETIGEVTFIISGEHLNIDGLFIKRPYRRKGFGTILLKLVENLASKSGIKNISFRASPIDNLSLDLIKKWYSFRGYSIKRRNIMHKSLDPITV